MFDTPAVSVDRVPPPPSAVDVLEQPGSVAAELAAARPAPI
jgi:hypothetical protein